MEDFGGEVSNFQDSIVNINFTHLKNGQYEVVKCIGEGGFGKVFLVKDCKSNKEEDELKAIKILTRNLIDYDDLLETIDEINILKQSENKYIITYFDCFIQMHRACLVTCFCEDGDLNFLIERNRNSQISLQEEQIFEWLCQMLMGLSYLHNKNIIHRDIKPANIFLHKNSVKLGDLGLARTITTLKKTTNFAGTINYLSPELIEEGELSSYSDIWAIGCVLFELITYKRAFEGKSYYQIIKAIVEKEVRKCDTSPRLEICLKKTLDKKPKNRLSAAEILELINTN